MKSSRSNVSVNPVDCPAGTRLLVRFQDWSVCEHSSEVVVLEWSPGGRVKLQNTAGVAAWYDEPPNLVEVLGNSRGDKAKKFFSGPNSAEMWEEINGAKTVAGLRNALYGLGCTLQNFEEALARRLLR